MFKAYASFDNEDETNKTSRDGSTTDQNPPTGTSWLENSSFSIDLSKKPQGKPPAAVAVQPKEEKKPIAPSTPISFEKKNEKAKEVFYIDRRRDRANITVQYRSGVPRYGWKFCSQRPLGAPATKSSGKNRLRRYFHQKFDASDNSTTDPFVTVDARLEKLNATVREQPYSFEAWRELIDYQSYLFKTQGEEEKRKALYNKKLSIIDRALEQNANRLPYRLYRMNLRTRSRLFPQEFLLNEWQNLIRDCLKSSDDRTINETWFSYVQFLLNHVELFSIDKLNEIFGQYYSTYVYHMQTRSEKDRRYLSSHMIDMFHFWSCLLQQAGYNEWAVALYQSLIELNLPENSGDFSQRLERLKRTWDTDKVRFGEPKEIVDRRIYIEEQLKILSEEENRLFNSNFSSWLLIEDKREHFYQWKILNQGIHFHSSLAESLTDSSQIDQEILNLTFDRSLRPFLFQCQDQRQILQIFLQYLTLINGQPRWNLFQEVLNRWKLSFSTFLQDQIFLEEELSSLYSFIHPISSERTERCFSLDYVSRVYDQMLSQPSMKPFQIDLLLLYWYYLAENIRELKEQNSPLHKVRSKSLQSIIKKYLSLEEYRTCLRLYTHYARLEHEYFHRVNESRRIFDLCFQTIRANPTNFNSYDSYKDLCSYLSTMLKCELDLNHLFDRMCKTVLDNSIKDAVDKEFDRRKLSSTIEFVLKKLFPNNQFNEIISLVLECLKSRKVSKWDQQGDDGWSGYLRQNVPLSLEILFIFLNYSFLLGDPFEKLHQIFLQTLLPVINECRTKFTQMIIDDLFRFYLSRLWNHLFTDQLHFDQCTTFLQQIIEQLENPSIIVEKFLAIYACLLPLYGSSVNQFEQTLLSYKYNQKSEYRLMNKIFLLEMNFLRHVKIQRAERTEQRFNSCYEHRVRHLLREIIDEYPSYVQLWSFYEYFERYSPNHQRRLKAVLYDAMQNCPWAKSFYIKSIGHVDDETEWKFFLNVMSKSRVHILFSLEEFEMFKELFQMKTDQ